MRLALFAIALVSCATTPQAAESTDPIPFAEGMTRPEFDAATLVQGIYSPAAIHEGVHGLLIIRCHVMASGEVRNCRQIKPLPHVGEKTIARLEATRMEPSRRDGRPVSISYVFNFSFKLP